MDQPIIIEDDNEQLPGVEIPGVNAANAAGDDDDDGIIAIGEVPLGPANNNNVVKLDGDEANAAPQEWNNDNDPDDDDEDDDDEDGNDADQPQQPQVRRSNRSGAGTRKPRPYDQFTFFSQAEKVNRAKPIPRDEWEEWAIGMALVQYSIKAGLKKFGAQGEAAVTKELKQLHDMITFFPMDPNELTPEQKKKAIASLMFLTEKRNGDIKGRACADGRKQREDFSKQDATSPTVSNEAIFLTALIEAMEERDVACFDIPGAFLHAETDEEVIMLLKGRLAELMVMVEPSLYRKYITVNSRGETMLYVRMHKALYGMLRSALLFYRKLVSDLEESGFVINPYDPCVANRIVNGKQQTVVWHVDDLKVSHKDPEVNTAVRKWLVEKYGDCAEHRGKFHEYLGMDLDYSEKGKVKIRMVPYLQSIIDEFPEEIMGTRVTPAADYLFHVRDDASPLPEEQAGIFHRTVARLVWVQARGRRDTQTAVSFLMTRVKAPDEDDWGKLKRVLQYIKGTIHMPLVLSADSMTMPKWWIDASYSVHHDMKGHTGAMVGFGQGMPISFSHKQKLNVKSSTEGEVVGVDDAMPQVCWTRYFLQAQGYEMQPSLIYQDNKSAMLLEEFGKASSSKRTKHINVRYFFIKDKINQGEVRLEHCPTKEMWADVNSKPRQGKGFALFRSKLMGIEPDYNDAKHKQDWEIIAAEKIRMKKERDALKLAKAPNGPVKLIAMTTASPQECVGASADKENLPPQKKKGHSPSGRTSVQVVRGASSQPSIILVQGRRWSKNVYINARSAGLSVDRAWLEAFV